MSRVAEMSEAAYGVICGLAQPTTVVEPAGITASEDVWQELRDIFPVAEFHRLVKYGVIGYNEEAGT